MLQLKLQYKKCYFLIETTETNVEIESSEDEADIYLKERKKQMRQTNQGKRTQSGKGQENGRQKIKEKIIKTQEEWRILCFGLNIFTLRLKERLFENLKKIKMKDFQIYIQIVKDIAKLFSYLAESINDQISKEDLQPTIRHQINQFINDRCQELTLTMCLRVIYEIQYKHPKILDKDNITYLISLQKIQKQKCKLSRKKETEIEQKIENIEEDEDDQDQYEDYIDEDDISEISNDSVKSQDNQDEEWEDDDDIEDQDIDNIKPDSKITKQLNKKRRQSLSDFDEDSVQEYYQEESQISEENPHRYRYVREEDIMRYRKTKSEYNHQKLEELKNETKEKCYQGPNKKKSELASTSNNEQLKNKPLQMMRAKKVQQKNKESRKKSKIKDLKNKIRSCQKQKITLKNQEVTNQMILCVLYIYIQNLIKSIHYYKQSKKKTDIQNSNRKIIK
ncbi:unnamed protein product [Paramecium sonneborni]|uniref:Protein SDA1 n=1 Tax=Paramecium sonneborni TaxID=65129 RepID=A0A8S1MBI3_9CILI|nr:unnamed protein product [Paramecium sonneborni]